jgi:hypothetical protein
MITAGTMRPIDQISLLVGSVSSVFRSSTVWFAAEVVSSSGTCPATVIVSETSPSCIVRSARTVTDALTTIFSITALLNPASSALTL